MSFLSNSIFEMSISAPFDLLIVLIISEMGSLNFFHKSKAWSSNVFNEFIAYFGNDAGVS